MLLYRYKPSSPAQADTVGNLSALAQGHDLVTVPAAWPIGVSPLAQTVDACQRRDTREVGTDRLGRLLARMGARSRAD